MTIVVAKSRNIKRLFIEHKTAWSLQKFNNSKKLVSPESVHNFRFPLKTESTDMSYVEEMSYNTLTKNEITITIFSNNMI